MTELKEYLLEQTFTLRMVVYAENQLGALLTAQEDFKLLDGAEINVDGASVVVGGTHGEIEIFDCNDE